MFFEWLEFLSWRWLLIAHLIAIGLLGGPFAYIFLTEQYREVRRIFSTSDSDD